MLIRRLFGGVVALVCVALLSSCALLPPALTGTIADNSGQVADAQMRLIADAVKHHDAAALKKLFSPRAREKATDLDSGLEYFLSVFPSRITSWKLTSGVPGSDEDDDYGKRTVELGALYKVSAGGKEYDVFFTDYTADDKDPSNVGIHSLGAVPYQANIVVTPSGKYKPFGAWEATFAPGVYVPKK